MYFQPIQIIFAFMVGTGIGAIYYAGLLLTVKALFRSKRPWLLFMFSFFIRMGVIVVGLYIVMNNRWEQIVVCLIGILLARRIAIQYHRSAQSKIQMGG